MNDLRWGFEEGDEWDEVVPARERQAATDTTGTTEELFGQDPDGAVTVVVGPDAAVLEVRVDPDWRRSVDPRAFGPCVVAAANNATMQALAWQVENAPVAPPVAPPVPSPAAVDETPLTRNDIRRLLDAVTADVDRVAGQVTALAQRRVSVTSAGRRLTATAQRGQVVDVTADANWAASARPGEIESEVFDVLARLRRDSDPGQLTGALQTSAIAELNALASDPQTLLRRIGLLPRSEES